MSRQLTKTDILYLQRVCAVCGIYNGPIDGRWTAELAESEETLDQKRRAIGSDLGTFDARTERNIGSLMPPAQQAARRFMKAALDLGLSVRIISGSRTYAEQDALFAIGRTTQLSKKPVTNARGGQSNHNFGIAWDVGIFEADGRYMDGRKKGDTRAYADLGKLAKAKLKDIEWGGDWTSFADPPHYQVSTAGRSTAAVRQLFEAGKPFFT
jgi:peptidoglycan LD-endopeptidase CwlK